MYLEEGALGVPPHIGLEWELRQASLAIIQMKIRKFGKQINLEIVCAVGVPLAPSTGHQRQSPRPEQVEPRSNTKDEEHSHSACAWLDDVVHPDHHRPAAPYAPADPPPLPRPPTPSSLEQAFHRDFRQQRKVAQPPHTRSARQRPQALKRRKVAHAPAARGPESARTDGGLERLKQPSRTSSASSPARRMHAGHRAPYAAAPSAPEEGSPKMRGATTRSCTARHAAAPASSGSVRHAPHRRGLAKDHIHEGLALPRYHRRGSARVKGGAHDVASRESLSRMCTTVWTPRGPTAKMSVGGGRSAQRRPGGEQRGWNATSSGSASARSTLDSASRGGNGQAERGERDGDVERLRERGAIDVVLARYQGRGGAGDMRRAAPRTPCRRQRRLLSVVQPKDEELVRDARDGDPERLSKCASWFAPYCCTPTAALGAGAKERAVRPERVSGEFREDPERYAPVTPPGFPPRSRPASAEPRRPLPRVARDPLPRRDDPFPPRGPRSAREKHEDLRDRAPESPRRIASITQRRFRSPTCASRRWYCTVQPPYGRDGVRGSGTWSLRSRKGTTLNGHCGAWGEDGGSHTRGRQRRRLRRRARWGGWGSVRCAGVKPPLPAKTGGCWCSLRRGSGSPGTRRLGVVGAGRWVSSLAGRKRRARTSWSSSLARARDAARARAQRVRRPRALLCASSARPTTHARRVSRAQKERNEYCTHLVVLLEIRRQERAGARRAVTTQYCGTRSATPSAGGQTLELRNLFPFFMRASTESPYEWRAGEETLKKSSSLSHPPDLSSVYARPARLEGVPDVARTCPSGFILAHLAVVIPRGVHSGLAGPRSGTSALQIQFLYSISTASSSLWKLPSCSAALQQKSALPIFSTQNAPPDAHTGALDVALLFARTRPSGFNSSSAWREFLGCDLVFAGACLEVRALKYRVKLSAIQRSNPRSQAKLDCSSSNHLQKLTRARSPMPILRTRSSECQLIVPPPPPLLPSAALSKPFLHIKLAHLHRDTYRPALRANSSRTTPGFYSGLRSAGRAFGPWRESGPECDLAV
ncbi:hypothetical protein DFH09DRAFT_1087500 [Mycena vulgaris]|nr:hypothetical protein DFH09DRAFT_1087500 [Mycena vulgaris]